MTTSEAIAYCNKITKEHSSTFYLGSRLFGPQERKAVAVVYAVCRSGDDAVDEVSSAQMSAANLSIWWRHIENAYAQTPDPNEPLELGLAWVLENYDVPRAAFEELYLGLASDISGQCIQTMDELMLYCRRVAGVIGLLISPIAGYRGGEATLEHALALGNAMQLTNILRDVGEDLSRNRCYLPKERLEYYKIDLDALRRGEVSENYIALLEELSDLAHKLYRSGWQGIPKLKGVAATAVGVAALNYEGILHKLRQNGYNNLTERAHLKTYERIALIPKAFYSVYGSAL
ncbi:MAG: phytoene/squalene synthase family protein [Trueperaceae bacterium]|nr:phytoene/squalene synthase family protein [Trueperaceae bacterium]